VSAASTRRLTITASSVLRTGQANGRPWTLHKIEATDEHGKPVEAELKSFHSLPNGPVDVQVERQEHEKYGVSYLLKPLNGSQGDSKAHTGPVDEGLEGRVAELERRVTTLFQECEALRKLVVPPAVSRPEGSDPVPRQADIPVQDGEIPF
jgi:hypothetical protein